MWADICQDLAELNHFQHIQGDSKQTRMQIPSGGTIMVQVNQLLKGDCVHETLEHFNLFSS